MHAILAALFAAVFTFCHASTAQHAINQPEVTTNDLAVFTTPVSSSIVSSETATVYADGECASCSKMTNVSYSVR